jgi:hypothetical protein
MFKDFGKRLQRDSKRAVDVRVLHSEELRGSCLKVSRVVFLLMHLRLLLLYIV